MPDLTREIINYSKTPYYGEYYLKYYGYFLTQLNKGIIGIPTDTSGSDNLSSTSGFKATCNRYHFSKLDELFSVVFGAINRSRSGRTFNFFARCKPSYLTIGVTRDNFPVYSGTRLCYYPEAGSTNPE